MTSVALEPSGESSSRPALLSILRGPLWKTVGLACAALLGASWAFTDSPPSCARRPELCQGATAAEPLPLPDGMRIPTYSPAPIPFHRGEQLIYRASWIGIPAATAELVLDAERNDPALLTAEVSIHTNRFTDKLYPIRDYLRESLGAESLSPVTLYTRQREGRRRDDFNVTFNRVDHIVTMVRHYPRGVQTREFLSENPSGPISGALMALAQPLKVGDSLKFDTFISLNRYVFELEVVGRERISTPLGEFDALRVVPSIAYVSEGKIRDQAHRTTIWVSADARRLPLRIQSAVFIGSIRIDLIKIIDAAHPTAPDPDSRGRNDGDGGYASPR
jgi:hypothetical protein